MLYCIERLFFKPCYSWNCRLDVPTVHWWSSKLNFNTINYLLTPQNFSGNTEPFTNIQCTRLFQLVQLREESGYARLSISIVYIPSIASKISWENFSVFQQMTTNLLHHCRSFFLMISFLQNFQTLLTGIDSKAGL